MTVVVTGASGFIARAVLRELDARGADFVAVSRKPAGFGRREAIVQSYHQTPPGDVLLHLAESSNQSTIEQIGHDYVTEVTGLVDGLIEKSFSRVVYASSAVVYGTSDLRPQVPEAATEPTYVYARSKFENERRVVKAGGVVARISNVYGPGMSTENVVSRVLEQLPNDGDIHIIDDNPVRDFIWVDDVARGLADMALDTTSGVFNLGTGIGTSIRDLAELAVRLAGPRRRELLPSHPSQIVNVRVLDITGTTAAFGWRPVVSLEQGLGLLISGPHGR